MSTKRFVPMLLAASVLVTGFTGAFVFSPNAYGITSVDELSDVDRSSWAFDALRDLVEKYNVIEGYPDKTFRGDHKATRYEMAAALNALIRHIGKDIARLGTEKADKEDLAKLAKLQEEFKAELAALQARTDALEARAAKIEAKNEEQDNRLTVLEKLKIYGDVTIGGFADIGSRGGNGTPWLGQGHNTYQTNGFGQRVAVGSSAGEGFSDSISMLGRARINIDYPIVEDLDGEGVVGEGTLHTRLVAAFGRTSPLMSNVDNATRATDGGYMLSGVSRVASDSSVRNEGLNTGSSNTRANVYLESAYYTQEYRSGIPILTDILPGVDLMPDDENWKLSLKTKVGLIPWREIFQQSPYTGDETSQFQNTALLNNAAIPVNTVSPMLAFEWHQGLGEWHSLDVKTALSSIDVTDAMSALALTYEGSLNYNWGWASDWLDLPGNIYAGGWWLNGRGGSNSLITGQTGLNATMWGSAEDMVSSMATDPVAAIYQNYKPNNPNQGMNTITQNFFLPLGSLGTPAALAGALGLTTAQLANPNQMLSAAAVTNLNAGKAVLLGCPVNPNAAQLNDYMKGTNNTGVNPFFRQIRPFDANNTSLAAYYQEVLRANGLGTTSGRLPTGDTSTGSMDVNDNAHGFYCGINQEIHRGAGVFFNYAVSDTGPQSMLASALMTGTGRNASYSPANNRIYGVKQSMVVGVEVPMKALHLPWRHKDVLGFGYAQLKPNDAFGSTYAGSRNNWGSVSAGSSSRLFIPQNGIIRNAAGQWKTPQNALQQNVHSRSYMEHIMELYYKVHVNDRFSITPNVQFIINRLGDPSNDLMTVIGLRTTFKF